MTGHRVRTAVLLGTAILIVVGAAAWFFVLSPRLDTASQTTTQAEELAFSNVALTNRYHQALDQAETAPQAAADAQALFSTMPQQADLPTVLGQISDAATRAGIAPADISMITTSVPVPLVAKKGEATAEGAAAKSLGVDLATMGFSLTVTGSRPDLLGFLDNLQKLERASLITSTSLASTIEPGAEGPAANQETLTASGTMFVLNSQLPDLVANVNALLEEVRKDQEQAEPAAG